MLKRLVFLLIIPLFTSFETKAQTYVPFYGSIVGNYHSDTILNYLMTFESLGVKELGTTALQNTQDWIVSKYAEYGYTDITVDPFSYFGQSTANIIVKKQGCVYPDTYVIVDGHYDTKNGTGTNDNGSGTSIIMEMARVLKDVQTKYSILFIHFSGEEDGLKGSLDYVNTVVIPNNMDIRVVFNIDEVGGVSGMTNNTIVCERDEGIPNSNNAQSAVITDELVTCVGLYSNLATEISFAYASDYMPFEDNGEIITGFYEKNESPYAHTANDNLANTDPAYIHEVGKAACGATMHFAQAFTATPLTASTCSDYTSPSGNYIWNSTGIYYDTLTTIAGCDSILEIDLTVNSFSTNVFLNIDSLFTDIPNATSYQWYDCDLMQNIAGETSFSYIPVIAGNYAAIVTNNGCTDTSECFLFEPWGIDEISNSQFKLYPNPAHKIVQIEAHKLPGLKTIQIIDNTGKIVQEVESADDSILLNIEDLAKGLYTVRITQYSANNSFQQQLIKD